MTLCLCDSKHCRRVALFIVAMCAGTQTANNPGQYSHACNNYCVTLMRAHLPPTCTITHWKLNTYHVQSA
ncbi:hypothetical protein AAKU58_002347 [Oxalobacteraceae bacterium GrIS 1.18]